MGTWEPPHRISLAAAQQTWSSVSFVHWRYEPRTIADLLPDGVVLDTMDGSAWVGLTPFRMEAGVLPLIARPAIGAAEVNVRTYVRVRDIPGIWFLSLELDKGLVAKALRGGLRLPYRTSEIAVDQHADGVGYRLRRERPGAHMDLRVDVGGPVAADEVTDLDVFLLARWRAFTRALGRTVAVPVEHRPWPLRRAEVARLSTDLLESVDLPPPPDGAAHVRYSGGVHARLGVPRPALAAGDD